MPNSILDPRSRAGLLARIDQLDPATPARWGRFTAPRMVSHLIESVRMALGELPVRRRRSILGNRLVRALVIHVLPFPRGAPTAGELLARAPASWASDIATLKTLIDRAAAHPPHGVWQPHPVFGILSDDDWGVLIYRHTAHHLSQFGA
ncbi:MAG TPA: DUF1569 domain-containing protein [Gemmatimonadaceae bacterium]|jgi:hypothetical protein